MQVEEQHAHHVGSFLVNQVLPHAAADDNYLEAAA
jgi:hypothetical protein